MDLSEISMQWWASHIMWNCPNKSILSGAFVLFQWNVNPSIDYNTISFLKQFVGYRHGS